jgi:hypothetical protein
LLAGSAPINANGLISIEGKVNAKEGINLAAGTVNVGGTVFAGAHFAGASPDFSDVVNTNGISSASNVLVEGGRIRIVAQDDVTVSGTLATPGAAGVKAGDINIHAGGNVAIESGAQLVARGNGAQSGGGTIMSWADQKAVNRAGSLLDASAGSSGAGGSVEFSAKQTVELAGGELRADGTGGGAAGSVLIDPATIEVSSNLLRGTSGYASGGGVNVSGADITLLADERIVVNKDVMISSRSVDNSSTTDAHKTGNSTGNSGNITLKAPNIVLKSGSSLDAHATGTYTAGDVTLLAEGRVGSQLSSVLGHLEGAASIQIGDDTGGATVKGRKVNMTALTEVENMFRYLKVPDADDYTDSAVLSDTNLAELGLDAAAAGVRLAQLGATLVGVKVVYAQSTASASVVVKNSTLEGTDSVVLKADTKVNAGVAKLAQYQTPGAVVNTPLGLGALYAGIDANATVEILGTTSISGKDLSASAHNNAAVEATIAGGETNSNSNRFSLVFGYTAARVDAKANIGKDVTINSTGDVSVQASNNNKLVNDVTAVTGPNGVVATALAMADYDTNAQASLLGNVKGAQHVQVVAIDHVVKDQTTATAKAGLTNKDKALASIKQGTIQFPEYKFLERFLGISEPRLDDRSGVKPMPFRLGGAVAHAESIHNASAVVGDGVKIRATDGKHGGSVLVAARTIGEETVISAATSAASPNKDVAGSGTSGGTSKVNVAAGLAIGNYVHDAQAVVGANAEITSDKIAVSSDVSLPIRPALIFGNAKWSFDRWDGLSTFSKALESLEFYDVLNGKSSASVAGSSDVGTMGFSGSANILNFSHNSQTEIQKSAKLNLLEGATGGFAAQLKTQEATKNVYDPTGLILWSYGEAADIQNWQFDAPVTIEANTASTLLFQAGLPGFAIAGSNKAIGFALSHIDVNNRTEALVREGSEIRGVTVNTDGTLKDTDKAVSDVRILARLHRAGIHSRSTG